MAAARLITPVRLSAEGRAEIDRIARDSGNSRSEVIRRALTYALGKSEFIRSLYTEQTRDK